MTGSARAFANTAILLISVAAGLANTEPTPPAQPVAATAHSVEDGGADSHDATSAACNSITWQGDYTTAVNVAKETGKPLWIHVVHDGCGPCERLKQTVFVDPEFVSRVSERFVAVQVDRFKGAGPSVVNVFEAGGNDPVDLFVFPDGKYLRYVGAPEGTAKFVDRLDGAERWQEQAKWAGYPVSASAGRWKLNGETINAAHLLSHANHRDKFSEPWLRSLSRNQLLTLHDHDHENRVRWEFVPAMEGE